MNAAAVRDWSKKWAREFRILGLPPLRPQQVATRIGRQKLAWLSAEDGAHKNLEALRAHLQSRAQAEPDAWRLFLDYWNALNEADAHGGALRTLQAIENDYLRVLADNAGVTAPTNDNCNHP